MAQTTVTLGGGGSAPGDAYSPTNKPRLRAVGTPDYLPPLVAATNAYGRYFGPRFTLSAPRSYSRLEVPLRNVAGGESLAIILARLEAGYWVVRHRQDTVLEEGQALETFVGPFELQAGESWGVVTGFNNRSETQPEMDKFYGNTAGNYPAPFLSTVLYRSSVSTAIVGENGGFELSSGQYRVIHLYGINDPKGVLGPSDPADVSFSGPTSARPVGAPVGMTYWDTTLAKPVFWDGSSWRDASGAAV